MLQGEGILEDVSVGDGSLTFEGVGNGCDCQQRCRCGGGEELHAFDWEEVVDIFSES